jgi:Ca-activated chloride channel homolog
MDAARQPLGQHPMNFARPGLLFLAVLLPLVVGAAVWFHARRRRRVAELFGDEHLLNRLGGQELRHFPGGRLVLMLLAALCLGVAAAGPQWGLRPTEGRPLALNIALVADISRSMLAEDAQPNRLEQARLLARRLLRELPGDRFGLVVFAGRSFTLTPLTVDHSAVELYLESLDPEMVSMGGSSLGDALRQATDLLRGSQVERGDRVIILLSDGEATEELPDVRAASERAVRAGIRVMAVGFGTPGGTTIEIRDELTGETRVILDEYGQPHVTRLDETVLREIASRTNGAYFRADDAAALQRLVAELRRMERGAGETATRLEPVDRGPIFAGMALLLLFLDTLLGSPFNPRRRRHSGAPATASAAAGTHHGSSGAGRRQSRSHAPVRAALVLLLLATGLGFGPGDLERGNRLYREGRYEEAVEAYRRALDSGRPSTQLHYNLGTALLALGNYPEAEQHLQAALRDVNPELRHRAYYNLGNRFLEEGRGVSDLQQQGRLLDGAIEAYRRALRLAPGDVEAKWNLELALRERDENREQQSLPQQPDPQAGDGGEDDREQQEAEGGGTGGASGQSPAGAGRDPGAATEQQPMSREEADRILRAIEQDERDLARERLRRGQREVPVLRDW